MCGIIAAIAERNVVPILLEGLKKLEYRGYDSAGIAVVDNNKIVLKKAQGKVKILQELVQQQAVSSRIGIGHTRWATHGKPSEINAHPHVIKNSIAIVHNGIIENYQELQTELINQGEINFLSETDSEVIAAKIYNYKNIQGLDLRSAVIQTCKELKGTYSICVLDLMTPHCLIAARFGSPLVIGIGVGEYFVASDSLALQNLTQNLIYLKDGDIATVTNNGVEVYGFSGTKVKRDKTELTVFQDLADKGPYRHFMLKEIFEQPKAITATLEGRIINDKISTSFLGVTAQKILTTCQNIQIIACGTSFHAGLIAKHWLETFAGIRCQVDLASEFRYYHNIALENTLLITISQSGETADTIGALRKTLSEEQELKKYCGVLTICNVPDSSLVRYSELVALTNAGPEIGVASTKAFTAQLTVLLILLGIFLDHRPNNNKLKSKELVKFLKKTPKLIEKFLELSSLIKNVAKIFEHKKSTLFLGRGILYPVALEGALKLKELSYIHAEAHPAGELKHGPLALIDDQIPVVVLMSKDTLIDKLKSNIKEVQARGGKVIVFADQEISWDNKKDLTIISLPSVPSWLAPVLYAIPLQILAYQVAILKGTDVDQPRNLAKSVTVE